jgi:hypothetical protein
MTSSGINIETVIGLLIVALNAGIAAVLGDSSLVLPPGVHAALVGVAAASGAVLLYLRPAAPAGALVVPATVTTRPTAVEATVSHLDTPA